MILHNGGQKWLGPTLSGTWTRDQSIMFSTPTPSSAMASPTACARPNDEEEPRPPTVDNAEPGEGTAAGLRRDHKLAVDSSAEPTVQVAPHTPSSSSAVEAQFG